MMGKILYWKYYVIGGEINNLWNTYGSSIAENLIDNRDCTEKFSLECFSIESKSHSIIYLNLLGTIYILSSRPSLGKLRDLILFQYSLQYNIWSNDRYFHILFLFFIIILYDYFIDLAQLSVDETGQLAFHLFPLFSFFFFLFRFLFLSLMERWVFLWV